MQSEMRILSQPAREHDGFWSLRIYYAEEDEGRLTVDIMRLGSMKGSVKVRYTTAAWLWHEAEGCPK